MNIIFMGTPDFAVPALQRLISSKEHKVVAVFSQEPKKKGRGLKVTESPVHQLANANNIKTYTPKSLRNDQSLDLINSIEADIIVVVAYGFIIPQNILDSKKYGCLNIHPSKLPKFRGAAPLQRTIIAGETESAVCIMQMDAGLDTGDILLQEDFILDPRITLVDLHDKCAKIGGKLLIKTLDNIEELPGVKQSDQGLVYAHKLNKEEGRIDWEKSAFEIDCMVRGMNPWPGVYFEYEGKKIKILDSNYSEEDCKDRSVGKILNHSFDVVCGSGVLHVKTVKPEGKQAMSAKDYLNGNPKIIINSL